MTDFAIVIPNYNQSHFLPWALESLRCQPVTFRLALMDGGSTDHFKAVAQSYSDIITHMESGPDGGQAAAIKKGKERVPGEFVAWLNADDYYFPDTLNKVASVFDENPHVDVVYGDAVHVTADGYFLSYFPPVQPFSQKDLARNCFICQPTCFVRRKAYEAIGGIDESLRYTMDWDLWHRLSLAGAKFQYLHEVLAAVRYYPGTKTMSGDRQRYWEIWRIERKYGRRLLPFSWAGFYRYDLSFKERRNFFEKLFLYTLDGLRRSKKKRLKMKEPGNKKNQTLYGFHRWEPTVETECLIHLPWYDKRPWRRIHLITEPCDLDYDVEINNIVCNYTTSGNGSLIIDAPFMMEPYRKIAISRQKKGRWKLLEFSCELIEQHLIS